MSSGYEKSPDYGGRPITRWRGIMLWLAVAAVALLGAWVALT